MFKTKWRKGNLEETIYSPINRNLRDWRKESFQGFPKILDMGKPIQNGGKPIQNGMSSSVISLPLWAWASSCSGAR